MHSCLVNMIRLVLLFTDTVAKTTVRSRREQDYLVVTLTNPNDCLMTGNHVIEYWLKDDWQQDGLCHNKLPYFGKISTNYSVTLRVSQLMYPSPVHLR